MWDLIQAPWHWSFGGFMIALIMLILIFSGKRFGVSSSFDGICSAVGFGKTISQFNYNWKSQMWLLLFTAGAILGGLIASNFMMSGESFVINENTLTALEEMGIQKPNAQGKLSGFMPNELFGIHNLGSLKFIFVFILGGFLIGFGTRYAGGCTSGHAISGLSNFQIPSLVAVIGFFIGGLCMTHFILPHILNWLF